jgi:hypothetical protein
MILRAVETGDFSGNLKPLFETHGVTTWFPAAFPAPTGRITYAMIYYPVCEALG